MPDLWSTLGYEAVAAEVAQALASSRGIEIVQGPPGVGKSWLARGIAALWEQDGGASVVAEGDVAHAHAAYYPFGFAMSGLGRGWRALAPSVAGAASSAAENFVGTQGLVMIAIQAVSRARRQRQKAQLPTLSDTELDILQELERLGRKRPVLLIVDNLHWWDASSLNFLGRLVGAEVREAFAFLEGLRVLGVQTTAPYQEVASPKAYRSLIASAGGRTVTLPRISQNGFGAVLEALGAGGPVEERVADVVYDFSGGHLALAARAARRIAEGSADTFLQAQDSDQFLQRLLLQRVSALGPLGTQAAELLQVAALIGLAFHRAELTCATGVSDGEAGQMLRYCRDEQLIELQNGVGRFVHDLYRQFFLTADGADRVAVHERLIDCLRLLRPGDYELRCLNALRAERNDEAAALAVHAVLQQRWDGRSSRAVTDEVWDVIGEQGFERVLHLFQTADEALKEYRFPDCLAALDSLPRALPTSLCAEADYIRAMAKMSTRSEGDRAEGRRLLRPWLDYHESEPELGVRIGRLMLYGLSHQVDKQPARDLEARLQRHLMERAGFDDSARDALYSLDRAAAALYPADVVLVRVREAAAHFGPPASQVVVRRPLEYYRCLVNYGAAAMANGLYEEAQTIHQKLAQLLERYQVGTFPRTDYARMNMILSDYRAGRIVEGEAVARQEAVVAALPPKSDTFYPRNALAVFLAFCGETARAVEIFDELLRVAAPRLPDMEPSMVYLLRANRCLVRYAHGVREGVLEEWDSLADVAARIAYTSRPMLVRRHELLRELLRNGREASALELDEYPVRTSPDEVGPLWRTYGRGFVLPEIEFWREN